jgi:hypothetical protein
MFVHLQITTLRAELLYLRGFLSIIKASFSSTATAFRLPFAQHNNHHEDRHSGCPAAPRRCVCSAR